jgi:hypothetical protein
MTVVIALMLFWWIRWRVCQVISEVPIGASSFRVCVTFRVEIGNKESRALGKLQVAICPSVEPVIKVILGPNVVN